MFLILKNNAFVVGRMTQYMPIKACTYIVVPQQKCELCGSEIKICRDK